MEGFQKLSIVGSGNVSFHLANAFRQKGIEITHVFGRNSKTVDEFANRFNSTIANNINELPKEYPVIMCITDDAIKEMLQVLDPAYAVAYTSGSVNIDALPDRDQLGVFYPLQTFSKDIELDYNSIPFFIEANNQSFEKDLFSLASTISAQVSLANSKQREALHLAAVWVNNFTNHVLLNAQNIAKQHQVEFKHLLPLLNETVNKLKRQSPYDSQTGPARRGDSQTIEHQLSKLSDDQKKIYQALTESIINTYKND